MVGLIHRFDPDTSLKPSTGAVMGFASENGFRYQLTRNYPMQLRLDYAWGRDGGLLYFLVGEAF